jgi:hypothetical protein
MQPVLNTLLYVADPAASAPLYAAMLGRAPVHSEPGFELFAIGPNSQFSLWRRDAVIPSAEGASGELGLQVADAAAVDALHAEWTTQGIAMLLPPTDLSFGRSFVAADAEGHRVRVYARSAQ